MRKLGVVGQEREEGGLKHDGRDGIPRLKAIDSYEPSCQTMDTILEYEFIQYGITRFNGKCEMVLNRFILLTETTCSDPYVKMLWRTPNTMRTGGCGC
jgi:hypothetical protein